MLKRISHVIFITLLSTLLFACGGSGGGGSSAPATAATPALAFTAVKTFRFSWTDASDATFYRLLENSDGSSGFTQVGDDIAQGAQTTDLVVPLYRRINAQYILQSCNTVGCTDSASVSVSGNLVGSIGYVKASNTDTRDFFGTSVSLSADGNTLAVGAYNEDSKATGISNNNDGEADDSAGNAGAVYLFIRTDTDTTWSQQAYIKASNTDRDDWFGWSVSLSADGNTLAVGAHGENSNATGIGGDQANGAAGNAGAVYVFTRTGTKWSQQAYVKASNTDAKDSFGSSLSLSADGNTLAVGAWAEDSKATGINGEQADNSAGAAGAVYLFTRTGITWSQQAYVKASNTDAEDYFGSSLSLSANGNTLAVGAKYEDSNATGVGGDQADNLAYGAGAVYVFTRTGMSWSQQAYVKARNTDGRDYFGSSLSLSADGNTLAVGAWTEDSKATGINGEQADNSAGAAGAVYLFTRTSITWSQQAYVKASNTDAEDYFGSSLSLSADGNTLAVGAYNEGSNATGINGDQADNSAGAAGAVYLFTRTGTDWTQQAYAKASNTDADDYFGRSVSLSADGNTLAVGASEENSNATGVGGDQADNSAGSAGAVYLY